MTKYEKATTQDEVVDAELQGLGVKFRDRTQEKPEDAGFIQIGAKRLNEEALKRVRRYRVRLVATAGCGLAAADGLLIYMCMTGKIELIYGLVFLAAASAFFGGRVHRACV